MRDECEFTCTSGQSGGALSTFGEPMASPLTAARRTRLTQSLRRVRQTLHRKRRSESRRRVALQ